LLRRKNEGSMKDLMGKRVCGLAIAVVAIAVVLRAPLRAEQISLDALVTPSTTILKDGRPLTFAVHGFIEFKSLAELFPYIDSQTKRWQLDDLQRQDLVRDLLRRGIESRIVSMNDERSLEAVITHTSDELRQAIARDGVGTTRLCRRVSGSPGEMEAFTELLECFSVNFRTRALELVSNRRRHPTLWSYLRFDRAFLAGHKISP